MILSEVSVANPPLAMRFWLEKTLHFTSPFLIWHLHRSDRLPFLDEKCVLWESFSYSSPQLSLVFSSLETSNLNRSTMLLLIPTPPTPPTSRHLPTRRRVVSPRFVHFLGFRILVFSFFLYSAVWLEAWHVQVRSVVGSGFWTFVDMASGKYLWTHLVSSSKRSS